MRYGDIEGGETFVLEGTGLAAGLTVHLNGVECTSVVEVAAGTKYSCTTGDLAAANAALIANGDDKNANSIRIVSGG